MVQDNSDEQKIVDALGEPILPNLDENTLRIRRNVLIVSGMALFLSLNNLQIKSGSVQGILIDNLDTEAVTTAIFFILLYSILHFTLNSWDFVRKWRVRATGAKVYFKTALIMDHTDVVGSKDPEQTSLYLWWRDKGKLVKNMEKEIKELEIYREKMDSVIEDLKGNKTININNVMTLLSSHQTHLQKLPNKIGEVMKIMDSKRIDASLRRFDKWFWSYQKEQVFRLVVVEWLFPMALGVWALYKTFPYNLFAN